MKLAVDLVNVSGEQLVRRPLAEFLILFALMLASKEMQGGMPGEVTIDAEKLGKRAHYGVKIAMEQTFGGLGATLIAKAVNRKLDATHKQDFSWLVKRYPCGYGR